MGNREALRELQTRLAQRLQTGGADAHAATWLAFECAQQGLVVALPTAGEIFPLCPLLPVPHTKPWFLGVANLRGQLHGVVDLAAFLGLRAPLTQEHLRDAQRTPARLLAFNATLGSHCAVLIDRLAGLRSANQLHPAPAQDDSSPVFAPTQWRDDLGRTWQELDLSLLARYEHYLGIAA